MTIAEMHVWFRQYAQQLGMQNVRAILPEQIDVLINTAISDTVNQLVRENVGIRNDRVVTDNSKIGQVNALRSLYKVSTVSKGTTSTDLVPVANSADGLFECANFISDKSSGFAINSVLYIVDMAAGYSITNNSTTPSTTTNSRWFPIRIIEDAYLADTLNDFVLRPRLRTPVALIYQDKLDLYLGESYNDGNTLLQGSTTTLDLNEVRVSYIATPNEVKYVSDIGGTNVDCDLPESMHIDILKHAVDLYNIALQGGLYSAQQNQQVAQREASRNEARPTNEGYQN